MSQNRKEAMLSQVQVDYACIVNAAKTHHLLALKEVKSNKTVTDYTTDELDPKNPSKAQTWISYTDESGDEAPTQHGSCI